ncbi:hypothetical protein QBZ16_002238 [Prototheca wickerhamii]|uniref:Thioredoxin domain-containing protein n=1 Tax=Prototheca wickerhamii TaxID=3111 RepID=A0AAD9ILL2_PROWI|nr:hypothetical protein QBZ16_002238 [Prototheca wickerhamii]
MESGSLDSNKEASFARITSNVAGLRTDEDYDAFIAHSRSKLAVVNFGATWCSHCQSIFPHFLRIAKQRPEIEFAVAQVDYMHRAAQDVTFTPTVTIFKNGKKVDEVLGASAQQIRDRVWLQTDEA